MRIYKNLTRKIVFIDKTMLLLILSKAIAHWIIYWYDWIERKERERALEFDVIKRIHTLLLNLMQNKNFDFFGTCIEARNRLMLIAIFGIKTPYLNFTLDILKIFFWKFTDYFNVRLMKKNEIVYKFCHEQRP